MLLVLGRGGLPGRSHLHLHSAWQKQLLLLRVHAAGVAVRAHLLALRWSPCTSVCGCCCCCRRRTCNDTVLLLHGGSLLRRHTRTVNLCCVGGHWLVVTDARHRRTLRFLMVVLVKLVDV